MPEAAIPLVAEGAVAGTMTAAEIAAAEAAAAAAAEAATAAAVEQAATQAAAQAAAEQAATQAAGQAAQTATSGIEQLLQPSTAPVTSGAPVQTTTIPGAPPPAAPPPPAPPPVTPPALPPTGPDVLSPAEQAREAQLLNKPYTAPPYVEPPFVPPSPDAAAHISRIENLSGIETLAKEVGAQTPNMQGMQTMTSGYGAGAPPGSSVLPSMPVGSPPAPGIDQLVQPNLSNMGANIPPAPVMPPPAAPPIEPGGMPRFPTQTTTEPLPNGGPQMRDAMGGQPTPHEWAQSGVPGNANLIPAAATPAATPEAGGLQSLFNQGLDYAKKNPLTTMMGANMAYNYLNPVKPYEKPKYKSTWNAGAYSGFNPVQPTPYQPNYAHGGLADLGGYSDGGRMLKGPGDGMSDDIPATIANKQPARLANEEFVVPADVVSHLGNGSSEAGAKVLYKMMGRVRQARTGSKKQGKQINPEKYLA